MKNSFFNPGFEFVFALSLLVILGLPPMLMAQNQKDVEIKIENGDTTINGKNIKELSAVDRTAALKDIGHINGDMHAKRDNHRFYLYKRRDTLGRIKNDGRNQVFTENIVIDSVSNGAALGAKPGSMRKKVHFEARTGDGAQEKMEWMGRNDAERMRGPMMRFERRNTQTFSYVNTDNNGISTRITFRVSEVSNEDLKRMPHIEGAKLEIADLNIVPEFSTGKTLLLFNLPLKAAAEVSLVDSEGKTVWMERSSGASFSKTFAMSLNGIYYLEVKQGNGVAVKRIMKEE